MENDTQLASRKSRIIAFLIDHVMISLIFIIPFMYYSMKRGDVGYGFGTFWIALGTGMMLYLVKDIVKGISPGKWIFGIAVRDEEDLTTIPLRSKLVIRNVTVVIWMIEFIVLAASNKKQRLGDRLSNTAVVKTRDVSTIKKIFAVLLTSILIAIIMFVSITSMFRQTNAYQTAEHYIKGSSQIKRDTGGIEGFGFLPSGSIEITNGHGEAYFTIKVKGEDKDVYVDIYLKKNPGGDWEVQKIENYD